MSGCRALQADVAAGKHASFPPYAEPKHQAHAHMAHARSRTHARTPAHARTHTAPNSSNSILGNTGASPQKKLG